MGEYQDGWNNDPYEQKYERVQDKKKHILEKRKKVNIIRLIFVCLAGCILLLSCFSFLLTRKGGIPQFLPDEPSASVGTSSFSQPEASSAVPQSEISLPPQTIAADPTVWNLWLISAKKPVESSFTKPVTTEVIQDNTVYLFDGRIVDALLQMRSDCNTAVEGSLVITSGYMGFGYLEKRYNYFVEQYKIQGFGDEKAREMAAKMADPPGTSDNHTGLAVHFRTGSGGEMDASFAESAQFAWLMQNAHNYGFVLRFPAGKQEITGMEYRPWHFRYVGIEEAKVMNEAGICLEEFVASV